MHTSNRLDRGIDRSRILERRQDVLDASAVGAAERPSRRHPYGRVRIPQADEGQLDGTAGGGIGQPLQRDGADVGGRVGDQRCGE